MARKKKVENIEQTDLENQVETAKEEIIEKTIDEKVVTEVEKQVENNTNKINAWWWY